MLEDGKVFDSNTGKNQKSLQFKVGEGKVIRGWDGTFVQCYNLRRSLLTLPLVLPLLL